MSDASPVFEHLRLQLGPISELCIDRPRALNALSEPLLREMDAALDVLEAAAPRCLLIYGGGERAFVAGADIGAMQQLDPSRAEKFAELGQRVFSRLEHFAAPVIAAVQGFALGGGCELALACDIVFAAPSARFGQPEVNLGLLPGFGGTLRLPRKIGAAAAARWILSGETFDAAEAYRLGWVAAVVPEEGDLLKVARQQAQQLASRSPSALRAAKALLLADHSLAANALLRERQAFAGLFVHGEAAEGLAAFIEKRPAAFSAH
jgi:enoyl-CoA hydratase